MKILFKQSSLPIFIACIIATFFNIAIANAGCAKIKPTKPGEVYLLRGLANIFSLGLDDDGKRFSKHGIENCVFNHRHWRALADDIVERGRNKEISFPIVIIGHSLGANVAPQMATLIGKHNIPVSYVVMLDPVEAETVGKNVLEIVNVYLPKRKDTLLRAAPGFTGELTNVDVSIYGKTFDHFNIDNNKALSKAIYERTLELSDAQTAENKK